jgi:lysophospholipase L1-like esterase
MAAGKKQGVTGMILYAIEAIALATANAPSTAQAQQLWTGEVIAPGRFDTELLAFAQINRSARREAAGTLFIGSSSIRLWNVKADFASYRPINHGFGGATVRDVLANYDLLTANYAPQSIIVYVGENDIVQGRDASAVAQDVVTLLAQLHRDFPEARIMFLSMKSSPARLRWRPAVEQANREILLQSSAIGAFDYIDVAASLMLDADEPDPDCFRADGIHLSAAGYQRWRKIIDGFLPPQPDSAPIAMKTKLISAR